MPNFISCKTIDLSIDEKKEICNLFKQVFHLEKTIKYFDKEFTQTCKGYSYHCICKQDDCVLASFCIVPKEYTVNGEKKFFGLCVDTMVSQEAQIGPFGIADMAAATEELAKKDGISIVYGFPNDNFYQYSIDILGWTDVGYLDFYLFPLSLFKHKALTFVFYFMRCLSIIFFSICKLLSSPKILKIPIEKENNVFFRNTRYDERHTLISFSGGDAFYTLFDEPFGTVAYIIDINPLSKRNFYSAFLAIAKVIKKPVRAIVYPSARLPFKSLIRLPHMFLPRKLHFAVDILSEDCSFDICKKMNGWRLNLSDFDVR